jgi:alkylation response protein AidB-like acyl-CoA dehydrogenase
MDFDFTPEQQMLRATFRKFVDREIKGSYARALDDDEASGFIDATMWGKLRDLGTFMVSVPEEYGGAHSSFINEVIITEELSRGSAALGIIVITTNGFGSRTILFNGNDEQKKFFLPKLARGEIKFALALTEPGGGTDILGSIRTTAVRDKGEFIINGHKRFISCAHVADYIVTVAKTDTSASKKTRSLTVFIVETKEKAGLTVHPIRKISIKGVSACDVFYDNVRVHPECILGELNNGWYHLLATLNHERILVAAMTNGIGTAAFEDALEYAKSREAFGRPIGQFQAIQHKLADTAVELELARLITYKAAWLLDQGRSCHVEAAMAKLFSSEMAFRAATRGLDILAGYGVTVEYDMQRYFRDSRNPIFSPISNEMVRNFIGERLGLPKSY